MSFRIGIIVLLLIAANAYAERIDCGFIDVDTFYVQSDRGGHFHENKLLVLLKGTCTGYGYISNTEGAYPSIMSMVLASKMSKEKIRVVVDGEVNSEGGTIGDSRIMYVNY